MRSISKPLGTNYGYLAGTLPMASASSQSLTTRERVWNNISHTTEFTNREIFSTVYEVRAAIFNLLFWEIINATHPIWKKTTPWLQLDSRLMRSNSLLELSVEACYEVYAGISNTAAFWSPYITLILSCTEKPQPAAMIDDHRPTTHGFFFFFFVQSYTGNLS